MGEVLSALGLGRESSQLVSLLTWVSRGRGLVVVERSVRRWDWRSDGMEHIVSLANNPRLQISS